MRPYKIRYAFHVTDDVKYFDIELSEYTLEHINPENINYPEWTKLGYHQCPNCPLSAVEHVHCPVASNISPFIESCSELSSYSEATVEVITDQRTVISNKGITMQRGLSSLIGLVMATSACPHTKFLRPMARFHLPFANSEETIFRAVSTYLLMMYLQSDDDSKADDNLSGLSEIYENLHVINTAMAQRLRDASDKDATVNAVVLLDLFAKNIPYSIDDALEDVKYLFRAMVD